MKTATMADTTGVKMLTAGIVKSVDTQKNCNIEKGSFQ